MKQKTIAVLLNGCGPKDGNEIREVVFTLEAIERIGAKAFAFALDEPTYECIDHITGDKTKEQRNMLTESARFMRGEIHPWIDPLPYFDALVIPGGFGTAKNLCDYAFKGIDMKVNSHVHELITRMHQAKKPIGAICIAPVLVAKTLGSFKPKLTAGPDESTAEVMKKWGANVLACEKGGCIIDSTERIVSTPAYMYADSTLKEVSDGIHKLIKALNEFR